MQEKLVKTRVATPEAWSIKGKQVALGKWNCWLHHAKRIRKYC